MHKGKNKLKDQLIESIREVKDEIENSSGAVTDQAKEHINDNDLILTYNCSETLTDFFIAA